MKSIKFKRATYEIAANLYFPEGFDESKKYPTIITVHPGGGVKEQVSGLYSEKLSNMGFVTLAFDASHQGESGGEPRYLEDPTTRVEDVRAAVDFVTTLNYVDKDKIGVLGICAGGGYSINASLTEKRIKAIATVSGVDIGGLFRDGNGSTENVLKLLQGIAAQRTVEANGAEPMLVGYVPNTIDEIFDTTPKYMKEAYDYYRTPRGMHPNAPNKVQFTSFDRVLAFSAFTQVDTLLDQPILIIAGTEASTKYHSETVYDLANGQKELFWIDGATHVALYDKPEYVIPAVDKIASFFNEQL